eukprot:727120-Pyramimonas_sp.AAC.1
MWCGIYATQSTWRKIWNATVIVQSTWCKLCGGCKPMLCSLCGKIFVAHYTLRNLRGAICMVQLMWCNICGAPMLEELGEATTPVTGDCDDCSALADASLRPRQRPQARAQSGQL